MDSKSLKVYEAIKQSQYESVLDVKVVDGNVWFFAKGVGKVLNIKKISSSLITQPEENKCYMIKETAGGNQKCLYISLDGLTRVLLSSRSHYNHELIGILGIDVRTTKYTCVEIDTIRAILETFDEQEMILQYHVVKYRIDLYFPKYKIAIECDEHHHKFQRQNDIERMNNIKEIIPNIEFIRYDPDDKDFNIYNVLNRIFKIILLKSKQES